MISNRPYLIRAIYQWVVDNDWTPHMQVDANYPGASVPTEHVKEGMIVLNVSPSAVGHLSLENDMIGFRARFSGIERSISFPPEAVLAVFARENGHGMPFPPEPYEESNSQTDSEYSKQPALSAVETDGSDLESSQSSPAGKKSAKSKSGKKPSLSVVK